MALTQRNNVHVFAVVYDLIVGWFAPSYERNPSFAVDLQAYTDAWERREQTGDESESLLSDELARCSIYQSAAEYPLVLFDAWRVGLTPKYTKKLMDE